MMLRTRVLVNPLHGYYREAHLQHVIREMRRRGPPVHRLRAAKALGVAPILKPVAWWRGRASLERARFAACVHAHVFERVDVLREGSRV